MRLSATIFTLSLLATSTIHAAPIRFDFSGVIDHTTASIGMPNALTSTIPDGTQFSGFYIFESDSIGNTYDAYESDYNNAIIQYRIQIGTYFAEFNNGGIAVINDQPLPAPLESQDVYTAQARMNIPSQSTTLVTNFNISGYSLNAAALWAYDYSAKMVSDTNLPIFAPNISSADTEFMLEFSLDAGGNNFLSAYGYLDSLTPTTPVVPLPSSFGLFGSALIYLAQRVMKIKK